MNARARMQTAGSGEVAGSRVGGLSSRSCEAIRPPLKLQRHAGWRMAARVCGAGCRALRGWYKSGFEADCVTHHAIQTAAHYCNSCIRNGTILRDHDSMDRANFACFPCVKTKIKWLISPRSQDDGELINGNFIERCVFHRILIREK